MKIRTATSSICRTLSAGLMGTTSFNVKWFAIYQGGMNLNSAQSSISRSMLSEQTKDAVRQRPVLTKARRLRLQLVAGQIA